MKAKTVSLLAIVLAIVWVAVLFLVKGLVPVFFDGKAFGLEVKDIIISGVFFVVACSPVYRSIWLDKKLGISQSDVEAVASHIPEADIFEMTDSIAQKKPNAALSVLAELLSDKNNEPIPILALLSGQMRRLYAARLAVERRLGAKYVMETCALKYDFIAAKLMQSARGFTLSQLKTAVEICADTDYKIKSNSLDDRELLIEAVLRIAAGEEHA